MTHTTVFRQRNRTLPPQARFSPIAALGASLALGLGAWGPPSLRAGDPAREDESEEARRMIGLCCRIIRYSDGVPQVVIRGPSCDCPGVGFAFDLRYMNRVTPEDYPAETREDAGYNWKTTVPLLHHRPNGELWLQVGWVGYPYVPDPDGKTWLPSFPSASSIVLTTEDSLPCHELRASDGGKVYFHASGALGGKIHKLVSRAGRSWHCFYYGSGDGRYAYKLRSIYLPDTLRFWQFFYNADTGFLREIRVVRGARLEGSIRLSYYDALWEGIGSPEDLKEVVVRTREEGSDAWKERRVFLRYYTERSEKGRKHDLKFLIGPENCERLTKLTGVRYLENVPDSQIRSEDPANPFAFYDAYFEYDDVKGDGMLDGRVRTFEIMNLLPELPEATREDLGAHYYTWELEESADSSSGASSGQYLRVRETRPDGKTLLLRVLRGGYITDARFE